MTATHYCETCGKKTTHTPGQVAVPDASESAKSLTLIDAIRCVTCGNIVLITLQDRR